MADQQDSDVDWVLLDSDNPADSSDDDRVLALSSGCATPDDAAAHPADLLGVVLALASAAAPSDSDSDADSDAEGLYEDPVDADGEGLYDPVDAEELPPPPQPHQHPRPLSGVFHHRLDGGVGYAAFEPTCLWPETVDLPDPGFAACGEEVLALASSRGLVCLRAAKSGDYLVANPATGDVVRLPRPRCDHTARGDPAVVITFAEDSSSCYHVVVAFPLGEGVYAYEAFSSRAWDWTVGSGINAVEEVVAASGVGALGRAFWRTSLGYFLCYDPEAAAAELLPAPQEVLQWPYWELGEMGGTLCVTCMDERVNEVAAIYLHLDPREGGAIKWSLAGHFEGGCLRNRDRVQLLRSQGDEVVLWDPMAELVVAMDLEGRKNRTIGPLSGHLYYADFIPYVASSTELFSSIEADAECIAADEED